MSVYGKVYAKAGEKECMAGAERLHGFSVMRGCQIGRGDYIVTSGNFVAIA
jgi:hypothetical protein